MKIRTLIIVSCLSLKRELLRFCIGTMLKSFIIKLSRHKKMDIMTIIMVLLAIRMACCTLLLVYEETLRNSTSRLWMGVRNGFS